MNTCASLAVYGQQPLPHIFRISLFLRSKMNTIYFLQHHIEAKMYGMAMVSSMKKGEEQ